MFGLTSVHGQQLVKPEKVACVLFVLSEDVVVKGAGGQGQDVGLVLQGLYDLRVTVTLVHGWKDKRIHRDEKS